MSGTAIKLPLLASGLLPKSTRSWVRSMSGDRQEELVPVERPGGDVVRKLVHRRGGEPAAGAQGPHHGRCEEHGSQVVDRGVALVDGDGVAAVGLLNRLQALCCEVEGGRPGQGLPAVLGTAHRLSEPVGIGVQVCECGALGTHVAVAEGVSRIAPDPEDLVAIDLDEEPAGGLAEVADPVTKGGHDDSRRMIAPGRTRAGKTEEIVLGCSPSAAPRRGSRQDRPPRALDIFLTFQGASRRLDLGQEGFMASRALCRAAAVVVGLTGCGTSETFLEFQGEGCERLEFFADADGDGFGDLSRGIEACEAPPGYVAPRSEGSDCDDRAPGVHPLAVEICGGADEDCDGLVDGADPDLSVEGALTVYADLDGDGFGDPAAEGHACVLPLDSSLSGADCDDADDGVHPDATEICDGQERDEDCDGLVDDADPDQDPETLLDWAPDSDGDGYGDATGVVVAACAAPGSDWSTWLGDCDDTDDTAWPGATERCDGRDTDCDGDASDAGMATFLGASGGHQDLSAALSAGGPGDPVHYELGQDGVLQICTATWDLLLAIDGVDVELRGHGEVVLDAGGAGTVVSATNSTLSLSGLTLTGGSATEGAGLYLEDTDFDLQGVGIDGGSATRGWRRRGRGRE